MLSAQAKPYRIIDTDRHVTEPLDMWEQLLSEQYRSYAPKVQVTASNGDSPAYPQLTLGDRALLKGFSYQTYLEAQSQNTVHGDPARIATTGPSQLSAMDAQEVDCALQLPSVANYCINADFIEADIAAALADAYHRWLFDYCRPDPQRLLGVGVIPRQSVAVMLDAQAQSIANGWRAVAMRPELIGGRTLGSADYDEFWCRCVERDIAVIIHGGTHLSGHTVGADRFSTRFALHACAHQIEAQMAFLSLLEGGVFERFPTLRIAFLEAGCGWLPAWLWRLDEHCYLTAREEISDRINMKPSDYFRRQCWIGFELDEPNLQQVAQCIGADKLLYGSDFPHPDHLHYGGPAQQLAETFSEVELEKILCTNAKTFLGL